MGSRAEQAREGNASGASMLWVPGPLPSLNQLLDERARSFRRGAKLWNGYSDLKRVWEERILVQARVQGFRPLRSGDFCYTFCEPDRRRDPSNVSSGALKLIEDALVKAELLINDGWASVKKLEVCFEVDPKEPGVFLEVLDAQPWERTAEDERKERVERIKREIDGNLRKARAHARARPRAERDA